MSRLTLALVVAVATALLLVPASLAALAHVRVEGKTRTLFGATQPRALADTALGALDAASRGGELFYHLTTTSFGPYVDQVGLFGGSGNSGWVFKVNGVSPPVGADQVTLKDGDVVLWYYAEFGPAGGPPTLELRSKGGCYRVFQQDDTGKEMPALNAVLRVDGRTIKASFTGSCIGPHKGLVRATAPGAIRSNALR